MKTLERGDAFTIPLGDGRLGLGQAVEVGPFDSIYMVVFDAVFADESEIVDLAEIVATAEFHLAASAGSELVEIGRWKVLGNVSARDDLPRPAFKVAVGGPRNFHLEDWAMTRRRPATPEEAPIFLCDPRSLRPLSSTP
ncbi:Imm26 family immunity protein [Demequina zhanjiangensis]|uniref:Imm26 family immunity protein n=1 Tax=Demequina zhanjiangensis TaxID=3051659 RepID=A0ABT8G4T3_9MICO|nr:Imm26 family immunity protein [Demequina sp. SYSU T00b26]MDN4473934.1 Imm26 family immunity protein [Demequina sp. SYSU T00b26]